jgi:hypothetical protein
MTLLREDTQCERVLSEDTQCEREILWITK